MWQGLTLESLERYEDAQAVYETWVAAEPDDSGARFQLALLLSRRAQASQDHAEMQRAIDEFRGVLDIDPTHYRAYNEIAILTELMGSPVEALKPYARAASLSKDDPIIADNLDGASRVALAADRERTCALVRLDDGIQSPEQRKLQELLADDCRR